MQTFDQSAGFYDAVYAARGKDYEIESAILWSHVCDHWSEEGPPRALLDVACGTGEHLRWLSPRVGTAVGADASAAMLSIARAKLPDLAFHQQTMAELSLEPRFDVITCLFASIAYVDDEAMLRQALQHMAEHLSPFGILALEPGVRPETVQKPETSSMTVQCDDRRIERITSGSLDEARGILDVEFQYTVLSDDGSSPSQFDEVHPIRLFSDATYRDALQEAGLTDIRFDERGLSGTGLFTARRGR